MATPIGNLEDITYRAVRILQEADLIACEDTRQTRKLLDRYHIAKPAVSYHQHNEAERSAELTAKLLNGTNVALVSDAGMPLISDPGYRLVRAAVDVCRANHAVPHEHLHRGLLRGEPRGGGHSMHRRGRGGRM